MSPSKRTVSTRSFNRLMERRNVDLPQPEGPIRAVTRPAGRLRPILKSACLSPYHNEKLAARIKGFSSKRAACVSVSQLPMTGGAVLEGNDLFWLTEEFT